MAITKTEQIFNEQCPYDNLCQTTAKRLVFVCSVGMLRSPTAQMVATEMGHNARACGSDEEIALIPLSCNLINWAHKIIFMNPRNYNEAISNFKVIDYDKLIASKAIIWDIKDEYDWGDKVLWRILHDKMSNLDL